MNDITCDETDQSNNDNNENFCLIIDRLKTIPIIRSLRNFGQQFVR